MTEVYIPTRARADMVAKNLHYWEAAGPVKITLVVDPKEKELKAYESLASWNHEFIRIKKLRSHNGGLGYIRNQILKDALERDVDAHIQADDDYRPIKGKAHYLTDTVLDENVVGCAASYSYHGLTLGNKVLEIKTKFPLPSPGLGGNIFAINTQEAYKLGGFPEWATCLGEDHEMVRLSIQEGIPWYYSTYLRISGAARYSPGGHEDLYPKKGSREKEEKRVHDIMHTRWPDYVSRPEVRYRCQWKKMMNDFMPLWESEIPQRVRKLLA